MVLEVQGTRVPRLGFGTWQIEGGECVEAVRDALEIGYRHLDTARAYGNEREVGAGLARSGVPREDVFLTTKVWMDDAAPDRVRPSAEASLRDLGTDYVDLLLLHWPSAQVPIERTVEAMAQVREDGPRASHRRLELPAGPAAARARRRADPLQPGRVPPAARPRAAARDRRRARPDDHRLRAARPRKAPVGHRARRDRRGTRQDRRPGGASLAGRAAERDDCAEGVLARQPRGELRHLGLRAVGGRPRRGSTRCPRTAASSTRPGLPTGTPELPRAAEVPGPGSPWAACGGAGSRHRRRRRVPRGRQGRRGPGNPGRCRPGAGAAPAERRRAANSGAGAKNPLTTTPPGPNWSKTPGDTRGSRAIRSGRRGQKRPPCAGTRRTPAARAACRPRPTRPRSAAAGRRSRGTTNENALSVTSARTAEPSSLVRNAASTPSGTTPLMPTMFRFWPKQGSTATGARPRIRSRSEPPPPPGAPPIGHDRDALLRAGGLRETPGPHRGGEHGRRAARHAADARAECTARWHAPAARVHVRVRRAARGGAPGGAREAAATEPPAEEADVHVGHRHDPRTRAARPLAQQPRRRRVHRLEPLALQGRQRAGGQRVAVGPLAAQDAERAQQRLARRLALRRATGPAGHGRGQRAGSRQRLRRACRPWRPRLVAAFGGAGGDAGGHARRRRPGRLCGDGRARRLMPSLRPRRVSA